MSWAARRPTFSFPGLKHCLHRYSGDKRVSESAWSTPSKSPPRRFPDPASLTMVRLSLGGCWDIGGAHARLASESARWLEEAHARGNYTAIALLEGRQLRRVPPHGR